MKRKLAVNLIGIFLQCLLMILFISYPSSGQDKVGVFANIDFNKVTPEHVNDYLDLEGKLWKPIQQEHIRLGGLAGWNVFRVWFTGTHSDYNYAVMELYNHYQDMSFVYSNDLIAKVHPETNEDKLMEETYKARKIEQSQSAVRIAMLRPAQKVNPSPYVLVTYLNIKKSNEAQFEKNIIEIAQPALQDRMNAGYNQGWDLFKVVVPSGDDIPFQYISLEYLESMDLVVKPGGADASKGMEPGKVYRTELWERLETLGEY